MRDEASLHRAVASVDLVLHLASPADGHWTDFQEATVLGTERLLNAAAEAGVRRFVYVSSIWVAAVSGGHGVVDEETPYRAEQLTDYIRSKISAEQAVRRQAAEGRIEVVIARPGRIFGPGAKSPLQVGYSIGRDTVLVGWKDTIMPTVFVEHAASALLVIAERGNHGQIYHVLDDELVSRSIYLSLLKQHRRPELRVYRIPPVVLGVVYHGSKLLSGLHPAVARVHRHTARSMDWLTHRVNLRYPNHRLKALGWKQPERTETTLALTLRLLRDPERQQPLENSSLP
jgi:nucleoside-diphosphate-sugar epimerase